MTSSRAGALDELDVQAVALEQLVAAAAAVDDQAGQLVARTLDLGAAGGAGAAGDPVGRLGDEARVGGRTSTTGMSIPAASAVS